MNRASAVLAADVRAQSRLLVVLILWCVYVVHGIDRTVMYVLLQPISAEFHLSDTQVGSLAGIAYILPYAIAGIPLGMLADRVTRKRLLAILLAFWSGITILTSQASGFVSLLAVRAMVGAAEGGAPPTMLSLLSDTVSPRSRPTAISLVMTGPYFGLMLGSILGGAVAAQAGWRTAVLVAGVPGVLLAVIVWLVIREPVRGRWPEPTTETGDAHGIAAAMRMLVMRPDRAGVFAALLLSAVVALALGAWMPVYLARSHGLSVKAAGGAVGLALGLVGGLGTLAGGPVSTRIVGRDPARVALFCTATIALAIPAGATALLAGSIQVTVIALAVWAFLANLYLGPSYSILIGTLPAGTRGTALAILAVSTNLFGAAGPQFAGMMSDRLKQLGDLHGLRDALLLCLIAMPLQCVGFLIAARSARGRSRPADLASS